MGEPTKVPQSPPQSEQHAHKVAEQQPSTKPMPTRIGHKAASPWAHTVLIEIICIILSICNFAIICSLRVRCKFLQKVTVVVYIQ